MVFNVNCGFNLSARFRILSSRPAAAGNNGKVPNVRQGNKQSMYQQLAQVKVKI